MPPRVRLSLLHPGVMPVEVVQAEAANLALKHSQKRKVISETVDSILLQADSVVDNRALYGPAAAQELFASCEDNLKRLMWQNAEQEAQEGALRAIAGRLTADSTPADVERTLAALVEEQKETDEAKLCAGFEPLRKLRKMIAESDAATGGAGSSRAGGADEDDLGEDGFAMTQMARSFKCPLLQVDMASSGELRPIMAPRCGHTWSHKGITDHFKKKRGAIDCPTVGCTEKITASALVDNKALAKEIKKAERDAA